MGRFDHLATKPEPGPSGMLKWKVLDALAGKNRRDPGGYVVPRRAPDRGLIDSGAAQLTWIGHASFLLTLGGKRVLIDPVLSARVGTVARLSPPGIVADDLPPIDLVLVTHNHRDHLDPRSLAHLASRPGPPPTFVVPAGDAGLVRRLGAREVRELEWWQSVELGGVEITFVPARHWSMHMPWDRNESLWGGYVIRGREGTAYHSGDTGFFDGFAEIGRRLGAPDWAMLPIGAYEPRWFMAPQHMGPEHAMEAFGILGAKRFVAMHWGTFRLTDEPLGEPPELARAAFAAAGPGDRELWILDVGETRALRSGAV